MNSVIITGSTGMVGKSILLECLTDDRIDNILLINRKPIDIRNPKINEIIVEDYSQLESHKEMFSKYDVCFHCMGVSSVGMNETDFNQITFILTKFLIDVLHAANPNMIVSYVSGQGTDSSENGKIMWARVKGKTENYIIQKGFKKTYMIRLGALLPEKGIKSRTGWYNGIYTLTRPLFPLMKQSKNIITTTNFGKGMINIIFYPQDNNIINNKDLNRLAAISK